MTKKGSCHASCHGLRERNVKKRTYRTHYYCRRCGSWVRKELVGEDLRCPVCGHKPMRTKPKHRPFKEDYVTYVDLGD
ncbi:hypothetical protein DRP04_05900 [Archaeoglobales archaeon]|nr:MAG: hypothetical protein DRP04_05900 [Archaeoglobales archaeon]